MTPHRTLISGPFVAVGLALLLVAGTAGNAQEKPETGKDAREKPDDGRNEERGELLDGLVAVVGDEVVTRSELAQALAYPVALLKAKEKAGLPKEKVEARFQELQRETRNNLVDNKLILMAARQEGMSIDDEVARRMKRLREGFKNDVARIEEFLVSQGFVSIADYERQMGDELLRQRMIFGRVRPRAEITTAQLQKEFDRRYRGDEARKAGCAGALIQYHEIEQVWFPLPKDLSLGQVIEAYQSAYRCYLRMRAGDFAAEAAPQQCGTEGARPVFGSLGEIDETKSFDRAFQDAFDALSANPEETYSEPFVIKDGIRILRVAGSRAGCVTDEAELSRLKDRARARLEDEKFEKVLRWWLEELRGKFRVDLKSL